MPTDASCHAHPVMPSCSAGPLATTPWRGGSGLWVFQLDAFLGRDASGRGSSIVSDGGCTILSTPDGSLSSGC